MVSRVHHSDPVSKIVEVIVVSIVVEISLRYEGEKFVGINLVVVYDLNIAQTFLYSSLQLSGSNRSSSRCLSRLRSSC